MIRKIYAIVSEQDFFDFRRRCQQEGTTMGDALSGLARAYAKGARIEVRKFKLKKHHEPTGAEYGGE